MKTSLMIVVLAGVVAGTTWVGPGWSQTTRTASGTTARVPSTSVRPADGAPSREPRFDSRSKIESVLRQLRRTEGDAKKAELTKQLEAVVADSFDRDLKNREAELAKLESRLAKLRVQLERRRTAKDEITQLQLKVLINDAEGLGFSDAEPTENTPDRASAP